MLTFSLKGWYVSPAHLCADYYHHWRHHPRHRYHQTAQCCHPPPHLQNWHLHHHHRHHVHRRQWWPTIDIYTTTSDIYTIRYAADLAHFALQASHLDLDADNSLEFGQREIDLYWYNFFYWHCYCKRLTKTIFTLQRNLRSTISWVTRGEATFVGDKTFSLVQIKY